jgi:GxxExxY protein
MTKQEYKEIYDVVGAAQEVHRTLGRGLAEPVYQEALAMEMHLRGFEIEREKQLRMFYKGQLMEKTYYADFYYHGVIIELKAVDKIVSDHRAQLFNYMRITQQFRGVLLNFGERSLRAERYLFLPSDDNFILLTQENYKLYIIN